MSTLKVDSLVEKTSGNGVHIAGHVINQEMLLVHEASVTVQPHSGLEKRTLHTINSILCSNVNSSMCV